MQKLTLVISALLLSVMLFAEGGRAPKLITVTPDTGKESVECSATGENLAKDAVKELYLTDGKNDIKVEIVAQKGDAITFKVPVGVKPGRYSLMVLTADGKQFIEQPVKINIE